MPNYDDDFEDDGLGAGWQDDDDDNGEGVEERRATVVKVVWQQPGNDFKILKMDDGTSWKGVVGESTGRGSVIKARGRMVWSGNYQNFVISKNGLMDVLPFSNDGLQMWLMDRLPEIGEARAKQMIKKWPGDELFEVMKNRPEELTSIKGITQARAQDISEAYVKYEKEREIAVMLADMGVDYMKALKAAQLPNVREILAEDPFELVNLPGITFQVIKDFVLRPNHPYSMHPHDPRIVRAYARELLEMSAEGNRKLPIKELADGGNDFVHREQMLFLLQNYGNWGRNEGPYSAQQIIEILGTSKYVVVGGNRGQFILLQELNAAEETVANIILQKLRGISGEPRMLPFEGSRLDDSQKMAASALTQLPIVIMTGGPGTGKTTSLKAALDVMERNGEQVLLASPTGKAAKRMTEATGRPAKTIHRLLEWGPVPPDEFGNSKMEWGFKRNAHNPLEADVVVIDEASMLGIELGAALFEALGGARIVLIGDEDQLPPVPAGQVLTDCMKQWKGRFAVPTYRLTKTHRQSADSWVIDNAKRIINGEMPSLQNQSDFQFVQTKYGDSRSIMQAVVDIYQSSMAKGQLSQLQVLCPMKKPGAGASAFEINQTVQLALNPNARYREDKNDPNTSMPGGDRYKLYVGDKVIFTKNNVDLGLVNGDTGVVEAIDYNKNDIMNARLYMRVDGLENEDHPDGLFELTGKDCNNLLLAYAMTIHKSQGSEWSEVIVIMDMAHSQMLKRQLLYTAVTRTSKYLRLIGQRSAIETCVRSEKSNKRQTLLFERIMRNQRDSGML